MEAPMSDPLHDSLSYHDCIPLAWAPLDGTPGPDRLRALQEQNLRVLAVVGSLEERHRQHGDANEPLQQDLERLHQKLDMMIMMFGLFMRRLDPPAPAVALRLSARGLCWQASVPPAGERGLVSLHLHPCLPEPFVWPAQRAGAHAGEVCARFEPFNEALEAALERHVFLHHRRSVAGLRPPAAAS